MSCRLDAEAKLALGLIDMQRLTQDNASDHSKLAEELKTKGLDASVDSCEQPVHFRSSPTIPRHAGQALQLKVGFVHVVLMLPIERKSLKGECSGCLVFLKDLINWKFASERFGGLPGFILSA